MDALTLASPEEIAAALMHALRFDGRRRIHDADTLMASLVAARLVTHLERCGFVVYCKPPAPPHAQSGRPQVALPAPNHSGEDMPP